MNYAWVYHRPLLDRYYMCAYLTLTGCLNLKFDTGCGTRIQACKHCGITGVYKNSFCTGRDIR